MRHKKLRGKLGRTSSHRSSLLANLSISLITHKKIETTYTKAKEVRKYIEKLVTTAKNNNLQAQREVQKAIKNKDKEFVVWGTGTPIREWIYMPDVGRVIKQIIDEEY